MAGNFSVSNTFTVLIYFCAGFTPRSIVYLKTVVIRLSFNISIHSGTKSFVVSPVANCSLLRGSSCGFGVSDGKNVAAIFPTSLLDNSLS